MSGHALISPSARYRNLSCVGSLAQIKRTNSVGTESEYAKEGTLAHHWINLALLTIHEMKEFNFEQIPDAEMRQHVQNYCGFIGEINKNFRKSHSGVEHYIEHRVKYNNDWWGTLDYALTGYNIATHRFCAVLVDFKYGRGVEVSAEDNEQLMDYILCFEKELGKSFAQAHCFIYQPRTPGKEFTRWSVDEETITRCQVGVLKNNIQIRDLYYQANDPLINLRSYLTFGEHCRFCPAKYKCEAFLENANNSKLAILNEVPEIPVVKELTLEQKIAIFERRKVIKKILDDVSSELLAIANTGTKIPGLKIVEGVRRRKWLADNHEDIKRAATALKERGATTTVNIKLVGIGEIEKQIGKGKIDDLTELSAPTYQLVPESDKRTEVQSIGLSELTEIEFEG